jgi:hypothetical protein
MASSRDSSKSTARDLFQNASDVSTTSISCSVEVKPEEQTHCMIMDNNNSGQFSGIF